jgi:LmbE family N-acetylglucosaminyl deacetylase
VSNTIVFLHAHPDDEALFTGGTMARLAAEGHRVVLVTATAGEAGLASADLTAAGTLGARRRHELSVSAEILGCARVVLLGYGDSGMPVADRPAANTFSQIPPEDAADRLAALLEEEAADVLTMYDSVGGYGHPDHVQVHRVGRLAATAARTPVALDVTIDRRALQRALRTIAWARPRSPQLRPSRYDDHYTHPDLITHRVDVGAYLDQKRAAMHAHASQAGGGDTVRTLAWFLQLPAPLFRLAFGREWFVEHGRAPAKPPLDDILASLRRS